MMQDAFFGTVVETAGQVGRMAGGHRWQGGGVMVAEAALRSAVMGIVVYGVLQLFRVREVRAQRFAWALTLIAALAMPALVKLPQPGFRVAAAGERWIVPAGARLKVAPASQSLRNSSVAFMESRSSVGGAQSSGIAEMHSLLIRNRLRRQVVHVARLLADQYARMAGRATGLAGKTGRAAVLSYYIVTGLLLVRLGLGVALTWKVRKQSRRAPFGRHEDIRLSARMKTPVTIGMTIVLPEGRCDGMQSACMWCWRMNGAHVRQGDSFLLLLANVHCALFWFSPYSWWLQRRLSLLGEALADLAAVGVAESRTMYAQVLLEFASAGYQPAGAVAMARASNLRPRIERLLNDRMFRESVGERKRLVYVAAGIVPIAMLASAWLVRVHAAEVLRPTHAGMAAAAEAVVAAPASAAHMVPASAAVIAPASSSSQAARIAAASTALSMALKDALVGEKLQVPGGASAVLAMPQAGHASQAPATSPGSSSMWTGGDGGRTVWNRDGDSTTLVTGDDHVSFGGAYSERYREIRRKVQGDFFLYRHAGKDYVIQDKAFLDKVRALYQPMEELGRQQEALGKQQEALGQQQEAMGRRQSAVSVPTPDMSKELMELTTATAKLKELQGAKTIDRESLAELQEKMGDIQGRLGELQGEAGGQQGKLGAEQGKLGEQQGKLGEEQGRLGERQGELGRQAQEKLKPMIDEALKKGMARPVD